MAEQQHIMPVDGVQVGMPTAEGTGFGEGFAGDGGEFGREFFGAVEDHLWSIPEFIFGS